MGSRRSTFDSSEEGASRMRESSKEDDMDLTPMVDVTFLLLIFFMITAAFALQKAIEVPPVQEDEAVAADTIEDLEVDAVVVRIDADNIFWIGAPGLEDEKRAPSVQDMLIELRKARESLKKGSAKLLVQASGDSRHEFVVAALDAGTGVGMEEIELMRYDEDDMGF
jgi:biopolymer transport protein ExbD